MLEVKENMFNLKEDLIWMHCSSGILAGLLLNVVEISFDPKMPKLGSCPSYIKSLWILSVFFNSVLCLNTQKEKNQIWKWSSEMRDVILNLRNRPEWLHSHQESPKQMAP